MTVRSTISTNGNRVVLIYVRAVSGGAGKNAVRYANILAEIGFDVILTCGSAPDVGQFGLSGKARLVVFKTRKNLSAVRPLRRLLATETPDICLVVDASNLHAALLSLSAAPRRPVLILREALSTRERLEMRGPLMRVIKRMIHRIGYVRCDHVIALTRAMVAEHTGYWRVPAHKVVHIPNGVPICPADGNKARLRDDLILCVARLEVQKDIGTLLKAFALLRERRDVRLAIAGTGRLGEALRQEARELGIGAHVDFLGHVDATAPLYARARLAVLTSLWEGFPNVVIEALAQGTPVVATCTPGAVEILRDGAAGMLCNLHDPEDLARKMDAALSHDWDRAAIRARAMEFSEDRLSQRISALFEPYLSDPASPTR